MGLYAEDELYLRSAVSSVGADRPDFLVGYLGTEETTLAPGFTGAFVAPNASVVIGACETRRDDDCEARHRGSFNHRSRTSQKSPRERSDGDKEEHRSRRDHEDSCSRGSYEGTFYAASLRVEKGAKVRNRPFDWLSLVDTTTKENIDLFAPMPDFSQLPTHRMPHSGFDGFAVNAPVTAPDRENGITATLSPPSPLRFTLPTEYSTSGGIIANGTVDFRFQPVSGGPLVACRYRGLSPTAAPTTPNDLNLGRRLRFVSCSDGSRAGVPKIASRFELTVRPAANYPVRVNPPVSLTRACADEMELLSPVETTALRLRFPGWSQAQRVLETDPRGRPALYYAWVFLRNEKDALAMRRLSIHRLTRPLLTEELTEHAGKCGVFTNPGDGFGAFVPAIIPGATYNRLIDAANPQLTPDITGDRDIFESIIIRDLPLPLRSGNAGIRLEALGNAGFRYLDYETEPLATRLAISRESSSVTRILVDVESWVFNAIDEVVNQVSLTLGAISRLVDGTVTHTLYLHTTTQDPAFATTMTPDPLVVRGWGPRANVQLGAANMRVDLLQPIMGLIPTSTYGKTNGDGMVVLEAARRNSNTGWGLCMTLATRGAFMSNFLIPNDLCDFRALAANVPGGGNFQFGNFQTNQTGEVIIDHDHLSALYQADDAYQWARRVAKYEPPRRSRVMTGWWPTTFSSANEAGFNRPTTPCFGYMSLTSPAIPMLVSLAERPDGLIASIGFGAAPLLQLGSLILSTVLTAADQFFPDGSAQTTRREQMAHEYGHFLFCSMLYDRSPTAVDHIAKAWVVNFGDRDLTQPYQYINEGFAEFVTGQVAGAANYGWRNAMPSNISTGFTNRRSGACLQRGCFDNNLNQNSPATGSGQLAIGRIATLLTDAFDGHNARFGLLPGNGDIWTRLPSGGATVSPTDYDNIDNGLERVTLNGDRIAPFVASVADVMGPIGPGPDSTLSDANLFLALAYTMRTSGFSWCDRCRVFALHSPLRPSDPASDPTIQDLWKTCRQDPVVAGADLPPPDADLRLDGNTCTPCPPSFTSDPNGVCVFCPFTVVGNRCISCAADAVYDGERLTTNISAIANVVAPNDECPETYWLRIDNPGRVFDRDAGTFLAQLGPSVLDAASCNRPFALFSKREAITGTTPFDLGPIFGTGTLGGPFLNCSGTPSRDLLIEAQDATTTALWLGTPTDQRSKIDVLFNFPLVPK